MTGDVPRELEARMVGGSGAGSAAVIFTLAVRDVALELAYLSTIDVGPALV